jgi:hypothetical protein
MSQELQEIHRGLGRIEGTQEELLKQLTALSHNLETQETRIRSLEGFSAKLAGMSVACGIFAAATTDWIKHKLFTP